MMLFSTATRSMRTGLQRVMPRARHASSGPGIPSGVLSSWYNIFGKSNAAYITWIVGGVLVAELITGSGVNAIWNSVNKGRTYESVDWSKFVVEDDEKEEAEEDDDEEEEEEGDDDDDDE